MSSLLLFATLAILRQVTFPGADFGTRPIPRFDRGFLLFLGRPCELTVYEPSGNFRFRKSLQGPRNSACSATDAAVAADGGFVVSISYSGPRGYAGGIVQLDAAGEQTAFIDTGLYMPAHIAFGCDKGIWTIGWQRDKLLNGSASETDYFMVRRFSQTGTETGAFVPRSLWRTTGEPASASMGYWTLAVAEDRMGAIVYDNFAERKPEWIEWGCDGKLLARIPLQGRWDGGKAYTSSGRLYARILNYKAKTYTLCVLDRETGAWKPVADPDSAGQGKFLLGSDGDDLVFKSNLGITELTWSNSPK
jgi:hypothetical protein